MTQMTKKSVMIAWLGIASLIWAVSAVSLVSADNSTWATSTQTTKKTWSFKGMKQDYKAWDNDGERNDDHDRGWKHGEGMIWGFGMGMWERGNKNIAIQGAIKANDYNAFVTARNADTHKPSDATVPTQVQFTAMVTHAKKEASIEAAIVANDYNAFVEASKPTQEEFTKMVSMYTSHKAIEAAITAKDYNAFVTAWNAKPYKKATATVPTQAQFTAMTNKTQK